VQVPAFLTGLKQPIIGCLQTDFHIRGKKSDSRRRLEVEPTAHTMRRR